MELDSLMTHFSWPIDGSIVGLYLIATMVAGLMVRRYVAKVDDFLVAGREMNIYLGIASLAATEFGIITCMYAAENGYKYGFAGATPGILYAVAMLVVGWTGFCIKPLRDSNAITIPELLDRRFGSRIRWLAGVVIVLGGLLNTGVFLRAGGDFLRLVCNFSETFTIGGYQIESIVVVMTVLLVGVATYTILGGMLSVLVTDFLQFVVMSVGLIAVTVLIFVNLGWDRLIATVEGHYHAGGFNPFINPELGWSWVVFNLLGSTAAVLTWQTAVARVLAAKDSDTGRKVYTRTSFFFVCRFLIPGIWGIAALAILGSNIPDGNTLHAMPKFLAGFLPYGLMGVLIAAMLAADMSTDSSYMLTWGSVIYNDILRPFHKGAWSDKKGLVINRFIVAAIGLFLLAFGLWYKPVGSLWDYLLVTGSIYLTSMSTLLIAACYWKRANNWGAAAAIIFGATVPVVTLVLQKVGPPQQRQWFVDNVPACGILAYVLCWVAMIVGSLLKPMEGQQTVDSANPSDTTGGNQ
jgi:solute:Na+ symporter, SSS family